MLLDIWKQKSASSRLHIVHIADSESLPMVVEGKRAGMNLTVETCPQYLYFTEDDVPDRSTVHKCKVRFAHVLKIAAGPLLTPTHTGIADIVRRAPPPIHPPSSDSPLYAPRKIERRSGRGSSTETST